MRNKFVYSCSVKICASRFDKFLESICCFLLSMEAFFLQNLVEILEEVVVSWQEVGWMWWMRQNFIAQFVQALTVRHAVGCFLEENWALSLDQCWLQELQFSVHFINLLSLLLRYHGFTGIQKAVVDQTGSRPQVTRNFFGRQVELWELLPNFSVQPLSWLSYKSHFSLHFTIWSRKMVCCCIEDVTSKCWLFKLAVSSWGTHLASFFTFPVCFKCQKSVEWSSLRSLATSRVVVRGSALMILSVGHCQFTMLTTTRLIFKALLSFAKLLEPLHCTGS